MKKKIFLTTVFFFFCFLFSLQKVFAADNDCSPGFADTITLQQSYADPFPLTNDTLLKQKSGAAEFKYFVLKIKVNHPNDNYTLDPFDLGNDELHSPDASRYQKPSDNNTNVVTFTIFVNESFAQPINPIFTKTNFTLPLKVQTSTGDSTYCQVTINTIVVPTSTPFPTPTPEPPKCTIEVYPVNSVVQPLQDVTVRVLSHSKATLNQLNTFLHFLLLIDKEINGIKENQTAFRLNSKPIEIEYAFDYNSYQNRPTGRYYISQNIGKFVEGYKVTTRVYATQGEFPVLIPWNKFSHVITGLEQIPCGSMSFEVGKIPATPTPIKTPEEQKAAQDREKLKALCDIIPHDDPDTNEKEPATEQQEAEYQSCVGCVNPTDQNKPSGSYTAIGCLPTNLPDFFTKYLWPYGLGIAGGIAFLLMLWGAFNILVSMGDPKRIEHGRELIVSAITGLLFIIFAVLILRIIGVDTLKIPGFS